MLAGVRQSNGGSTTLTCPSVLIPPSFRRTDILEPIPDDADIRIPHVEKSLAASRDLLRHGQSSKHHEAIHTKPKWAFRGASEVGDCGASHRQSPSGSANPSHIHTAGPYPYLSSRCS